MFLDQFVYILYLKESGNSYRAYLLYRIISYKKLILVNIFLFRAISLPA
jgi:hypothetical protein